MCFGPLRDLYGTPGAPKRARFGHEMPFGGPGGPRWALEDQMWSQLPPIGPPGMDSWPPYALAWYRGSTGPRGLQQGPFWPKISPIGPNWALGRHKKA